VISATRRLIASVSRYSGKRFVTIEEFGSLLVSARQLQQAVDRAAAAN